MQSSARVLSYFLFVCMSWIPLATPRTSQNATAFLLQKYGFDGKFSRQGFTSLRKVINKQAGNISRNNSCLTFEDIFDLTAGERNRITGEAFVTACPLLLYSLQNDACETEETHTAHRSKPSIGEAWGYGIGFVSLVVLIANIGVFLGPIMKTKMFKRVLMYCVALAVGTLGATGLLVLIPESLHLAEDESPVPDYRWKMATVLGGAYFVFVAERLLKFLVKMRKRSNEELEIKEEKNGHSELLENSNYNSHGLITRKKRTKEIAPVAWILLLGDALHNFVDGLSIGVGFTENLFVGISVSLAVVCEELPHELGDIAILLHAGLGIKRALLYNFFAAVVCYVGLIIGLVVGENTDANTWIFGFAGGLFVYIALSDMIPEMNEQMKEAEVGNTDSALTVFLIQNAGLLCGFGIILCISMFGCNIQV